MHDETGCCQRERQQLVVAVLTGKPFASSIKEINDERKKTQDFFTSTLSAHYSIHAAQHSYGNAGIAMATASRGGEGGIINGFGAKAVGPDF